MRPSLPDAFVTCSRNGEQSGVDSGAVIRDTDPLVRFEVASGIVSAVRDIVHERPGDGPTWYRYRPGQDREPEPPSWSEARGWTNYLRDLSDEQVEVAERDGLGSLLGRTPGAPDSLVALARDVARIVDLPIAECAAPEVAATRRASPRKMQQIAAFAAALPRVTDATSRVVDIGSGHGHLTRHLAKELGLQAEGWERDAERVAVANALTHDACTRFVTTDVRDAAATLRAGDLVVGLHACGALGDLATAAAAAAGAALALVGCCMQKREGDRSPLAKGDASLTLGRAALGLGNVRDGDDGVEADLVERTASRVNRMALGLLLVQAGLTLPRGGEMRGLNRRRANRSLPDLVAAAFAVRGLPAPSIDDQARAADAARALYTHQRRWELPRTMLARALEVWVALDRAVFLARAGYRCNVEVLFPARVSPRNIVVLATRR